VRGTDQGDGEVSGAGSVWRRRRARRGAADPRERRAERKTSFVKDAIKSNQWIHEKDSKRKSTGEDHRPLRDHWNLETLLYLFLM